jgi:G:T-mismatch repair DNA endonuclease (very short patch repair protein)
MDKLTKESQSINMSNIRSKDTLSEICAREALWRIAYRRPQIPVGKRRMVISILECSAPDDIEAFNSEEEATEFVTRLSERLMNGAW